MAIKERIRRRSVRGPRRASWRRRPQGKGGASKSGRARFEGLGMTDVEVGTEVEVGHS